MWLLSPLLSPALSCGKQMWEGPSQPHIPRTERDLGSWSLPSPFLCTTCLQKVLLIWAHLAVSLDSTHSPASSQSFWTGLLLTSLAACSSIFWNLSHLMASSSVFITFLWIPDERNSQGRFLPSMVSDGFVSTMAGKHGRSSSVSDSSRRWRLRHISVNRQAEKDKSEPPKACPQWSTSTTQAPPISTAFRTAPPAGDCVHKMPACGGNFQFRTMTTGEHWLIVFRFATKSECLLYIWGSCVWPGSVCSLVCPFSH